MMDYIGYQYQMPCSFGTDGGKSGSLIYGHKSSMYMTNDGLNKEPAALDEHIQPFLWEITYMYKFTTANKVWLKTEELGFLC